MVVQSKRMSAKRSTSSSALDGGAALALSDDVDEQLTHYAMQVPKFKKIGNSHIDGENELCRETLMRLISGLQTNPHVILKVEQYFQKCVSPDTPDAVNDDKWDRTVVNTGRIPKYWCAIWLVQNDHSREGKLTQAVLDLIDSKDVHAVRRIFNLMTMTLPSTSMPMKARASKTLCSQLFTQRLRDVGSPVLDWAAAAVDPRSGVVNWIKGGRYEIQFENGFAKHIKFMDGYLAEVDVEITKEFVMCDPWDPWSATVCLGATKEYMLHKFFKSAVSGPYKYVLDKKGIILTQMSEALFEVAEKAKLKSVEGAINDDKAFIGEAKKKLRQEVLKDAHAKAAAKSKRQRVVKLED